MTDNNSPNPETQPSLHVLGQYVKDLSFENPGHAPVQTQPNIDLGIDVNAKPVSENVYEVSLRMKAEAKADQAVLFISELVYAGQFELTNVAEDQLEPMLLIECPRLLFPFARRIVAEITREGGFPPLLIDPVDFVHLYRSQLSQNSEPTAVA